MKNSQNQVLITTGSLEEIREMLIEEQNKLLTRILQELRDQSKKPKTKPYLTAKETCQHFGISRQTLYNWVKCGTLPKVKLNGRIYFKLTDIEKAMERNSTAWKGKNNED